ncbi:MAG TPA: glycosyltransferase family 39 protein [Sunxiuqinia sp.]|nr:glycosyltransferase family 39 protein [Sunxiuqinia sp.]
MDSIFENKRFRWIFIVILVTALVSYFFGFFIDVTRDAGKYATVAKEIFQHGNFINLTIHGTPYDQKPPMLFWLGALGFSIGGISNFWFKFPVFLLTLFGFYSTYRLGKSMYNKNMGIIAAILLFFSLMYSLYSMDVHTDTPLQAWVAFALWQLYDFIKTRKTIHCFWGFTGIGLAMLSKGPIGMAIPAFAVVGQILLSRNFKSIRDYRWYLGVLWALVVASPALIGLYNQFGWNGIEFFFWKNNVGRLTGTYVGSNNTDYFFYAYNLAFMFLPWSLLFFSAAFMEFKQLIRNRFRSTEYFTLAGIWVFFIILSFSRSKLPNYMFILFPLFGILAAKWIDIALTKLNQYYRRLVITQTTITVLMWLGIVFLTVYLFPPSTNLFWGLWVALIGLTFYVFRSVKSKAARLLLPSIIGFSALILYMNAVAFPFIFEHQGPPRAARIYNELAENGEKLYNYRYWQYELFFYSEPEAIQIENGQQLKEVAHTSKAWIYTDEQGMKDLKNLHCQTDTIIKLNHLGLNRGGKFIWPSKREQALQPYYLVQVK